MIALVPKSGSLRRAKLFHALVRLETTNTPIADGYNSVSISKRVGWPSPALFALAAWEEI